MRSLIDVDAILPEGGCADAGERECQRNLANESAHILEEVSRIQSAMAIIKNEIRLRRAGDRLEPCAVPCCRCETGRSISLHRRNVFVSGRRLSFRQGHPSERIDAIARTLYHRDQTSRSR